MRDYARLLAIPNVASDTANIRTNAAFGYIRVAISDVLQKAPWRTRKGIYFHFFQLKNIYFNQVV
jgi:hypothetical protein